MISYRSFSVGLYIYQVNFFNVREESIVSSSSNVRRRNKNAKVLQNTFEISEFAIQANEIITSKKKKVNKFGSYTIGEFGMLWLCLKYRSSPN